MFDRVIEQPTNSSLQKQNTLLEFALQGFVQAQAL